MKNFTLMASACLIGIAVVMFALNYWHSSKCNGGKAPDEIDKYVEALNRRLLEAESQVVYSIT
jgi:hypothetical protein